jgi:hypothetical protein
MSTEAEKKRRATLHGILLVKYRMLVAYGQGLLKRRNEQNAAFINVELGRTDLELKLLEATMSALRAAVPIQFPTDAQIQKLRDAAARMDTVLSQNAGVEEVIDAADELIEAFPDFQL